MYLVTRFFYQVHHVDSHNNRNTQFHDLCGQIQVTFDVGTIYDVDDEFGVQMTGVGKEHFYSIETIAKYIEENA